MITIEHENPRGRPCAPGVQPFVIPDELKPENDSPSLTMTGEEVGQSYDHEGTSIIANPLSPGNGDTFRT